MQVRFTASQLQMHTALDWAVVKAVERTADSVDFHAGMGCLIVVRHRAFESPEAQHRFIEMANQLRAST